MDAFKKILVPLDFSPGSERALEFAIDVAKRDKALLLLVHVFHIPVYPLPEGYVMFPATQLSEMSTEFERLLGTAEKRARAAGASAVETSLVTGVVDAEIVQIAKDKHCDLIVMGTHGRSGFSHFLLGSVAEKVLRKAPCPVLTVPSERKR